MDKKISLVFEDKLWESFFTDINRKNKYDYKKYFLKEYVKGRFNIEEISLGLYFSFKLENDKIVGMLVFGLETEKGITKKTVNMVKTIIGDFLLKNKSIGYDNGLKIKLDTSIFNETGCGIFTFNISKDNLFPLGDIVSFKHCLITIYNFFYYDILGIDNNQIVFYKNPESVAMELVDAYNFESIDKWRGVDKSNLKEKYGIENLSIEDMGGNKNLKIEISKLISFYKNKDHFKKWNIEPPRGIILYGPPGTGKTFAAKIIASEIGINFYTISSSDIVSKWIGDSARNLKNFFNGLKYPCIVFIDEIDAIIPSRDGDRDNNVHMERLQLINTFLEEIDGIGVKKDVMFIGATNRIESIDKAFLRAGRFDYKICVDYPDFEARKEIWKIYLDRAYKNSSYDFLDGDMDLNYISKKSERFTGADIKEVVRRLLNDYALGTLVSSEVNGSVSGQTTLRGLLYHIDKFKEEKVLNKLILPEKTGYTLADLGGSAELKTELLNLIKQYKNKEVYEEFGVGLPRGILLYGPPGTGKTLIAKIIAGEIGVLFYVLNPKDIFSPIVNESVKKFEEIFKDIETPCIVFMDEIEVFLKSRTNRSGSNEDSKILNAFLQLMDGFGDKKDILFIGATNMIDLIDEAILRAGRFDRKILVDYPDFDTRKEIWKIYLSKSKTKTENKEVFDDSIDFDLLSEKTDGMVGADISEIVRRVKQNLANIYILNKKKHILDSDKIGMIAILEEIEKYKHENEFSMGKKKIGFDL